MITADTITDEQIRCMRDAADAREDYEERDLAIVALGGRAAVNLNRAGARKKCAELFEERVRVIEAAFDDARLHTIVDGPRRLGYAPFAGSSDAKWDDEGALVHVMSRPAGGEIRGYVRINSELRLRLPCTPLEWPELDEVVSRRLGLPVIAAVSTYSPAVQAAKAVR